MNVYLCSVRTSCKVKAIMCDRPDKNGLFNNTTCQLLLLMLLLLILPLLLRESEINVPMARACMCT